MPPEFFNNPASLIAAVRDHVDLSSEADYTGSLNGMPNRLGWTQAPNSINTTTNTFNSDRKFSRPDLPTFRAKKRLPRLLLSEWEAFTNTIIWEDTGSQDHPWVYWPLNPLPQYTYLSKPITIHPRICPFQIKLRPPVHRHCKMPKINNRKTFSYHLSIGVR